MTWTCLISNKPWHTLGPTSPSLFRPTSSVFIRFSTFYYLVLTPIFKFHYAIKCIIWPLSKNDSLHDPMTSILVEIGAKNRELDEVAFWNSAINPISGPTLTKTRGQKSKISIDKQKVLRCNTLEAFHVHMAVERELRNQLPAVWRQ